MKFRMIANVLILTLAAWLPGVAQQNATPQPSAQQTPASPAPAETGKVAEKSACACCEHMKNHGKEAAGDHASKACCPSKDGEAAKSMTCCEGKEMDCCKQDNKDNQTAMNCCAGKDGKMCAKKDGKDCCGKDAMACNGKNGRNCCAGHGKACAHGASRS
jgi:hypothetical protein